MKPCTVKSAGILENLSGKVLEKCWNFVSEICYSPCICISKFTIIGSDNGLSPGRRQAIIWTNAGILLIVPLGTNFSEILIKIITFSFKKMCLKESSVKWWQNCLGPNVLTSCPLREMVVSSYFSCLYILCQHQKGEHIDLNRIFAYDLTHWGWDKWLPFRRRYFQMYFLEWKCMNFD